MDPAFYRPPRHQAVLDELPLFAAPAPSVAVPTSEAAADAVDTAIGRQRAAETRARLLVLIVAHVGGGMTADELEAATGIPGNSIRPRLSELHTAGLIEASDAVKRRTRSGKLARAIFATQKGHRAVEAAA
jgi:hypothetical protein